MQQYVDRADDFLAALLTREAMPGGAGPCRNCNKSLAVWRCRDCVMPTTICRSCMRLYHRQNPFHRIERWNGSYFHPAHLREVGTYLLIQHHTGEAMCETLHRWCNILDSAEQTNDCIEQDKLREFVNMPGPAPAEPFRAYDPDMEDADFDMDTNQFLGDDLDDLEDDDGEDVGDGDEEDEEDNPYNTNTGAGAGAGFDPALASSTFASYHRVVHTNGLHHIPMVSCQCRGQDVLPLDLFAAHLLPASLKRIKTLFSAQVLDMFRLSNLELKASAYQFYQMLRRLTLPMAPAEVLNLYREFRRMCRIWRWMKKLKWAGYAGSPKKVSEVGPGELAIFCPACPQQAINIPDNWRDDSARHVHSSDNKISFYNSFNRWVYKRIFVADGNFKADHIRQSNEVDDVWLSEGSGMIPRRQEYFTFLATAIEKLTVSHFKIHPASGIRHPASGTQFTSGIPDSYSLIIFFLESPLRKHISSYYKFLTGVKALRHYWRLQCCLCPAWLLCSSSFG